MRGLSLALLLLVATAALPTLGSAEHRTTITEPYRFSEGTLTSDRILGCQDDLNIGGGCLVVPEHAGRVGPISVEDESGLRVAWALRLIDRFGQRDLLHTDCGPWHGTLKIPNDVHQVEVAIEDPATGNINCLLERGGISYPATTGTFSVTFR